MGFMGGTVLEPAAGIGYFFGAAPKGLANRKVGVELDSISARIAKKLYPNAQIHEGGLEGIGLSPGSVDVAISNVPFNSASVADAKRRYGQTLNLHNYFIARMIDATRPGGIVAVITTSHTMESQFEQRKFLASRAELVGAIRLPNNAFEGIAKTAVTTDILVFQKPAGGATGGEKWLDRSDVVGYDNKLVPVNEYFVKHPEMMLGTPALTGTMTAATEEFTLIPYDGANLSTLLDGAVERLPADIVTESDASGETIEEKGEAEVRGGTLVAKEGGGFEFVFGKENRVELKGGAVGKTRAMAEKFIALRNALQETIAAMRSPTSTDEEIKQWQSLLDRAFKEADALADLTGRQWAIFARDPKYFAVRALVRNVKKIGEDGTARVERERAEIFTRRTIRPHAEAARTSDPAEAAQIAFAHEGKVNGET
jgi:hypothetical protein